MNQLALDFGNQRWRDRVGSFRRPTEPIDPRQYDVALIDSDAIARAFVKAHHYSGTYPSAIERIGLYRRGELVGVFVLSWPMHDAVLSNVFPRLPRRACGELGRFVLLDDVPGNGETWFLARAFELLRVPRPPTGKRRGRPAITGIVSFSDPFPRTSLDGRLVFPGHVGTIYQAANATYLGRARQDDLRVLPDGTAITRRSYQKIRSGEVGAAGAIATLEAWGAAPLAVDAPARERAQWCSRWLDSLTRPLEHPGTHRYAWILDRRHRRELPPACGSYPKQHHQGAAP